MVDYARIDFQNPSAIVRVFENRGTRAMRELRAPIAEALHAEVLEVFESEGYGKWPGFAWQRRGEPPPGTPKGPKFGPAKPPKPLTARQQANVEKREAAARAEKKKARKLRALFGHSMGAVNRRYSDAKLVRTKKRKRPAKSYRRWQGNPKLLQDTGNLVGSLQRDWSDDAVEIFTNVPYAKFHISPDPRRVIPLRDFFDINTAKVEQDIVRMFEIHMARPVAAE
jgi:phage gpG-like protein